MHRTFIGPTRACFLALGLAIVACGGGSRKTGTDGGAPGGEGSGPGTGTRPEPGTKPGRGTKPGTATVPTCSIAGETVLAAGGASSPSIAFAGGHFAVAWTDIATGGGDAHLAIVGQDGKDLDDRILSAGASQQASVTALPDGGFLAAWQELGARAGGTVRAQRTSADGTPRGAAFTVKATADADARPDLAANAGGVAVAWEETGTVHVGDLTGATLADEQTLGGAGDPALGAPGGAHGFGLVLTSGARLGFAALSTPIGDVTPTFFRSAPGVANVPRIAAGPDGSYAIAWEDLRGGAGNEAIYMVRVGGDGKISDETPVSSDAGSADYPDVTFVGPYAAVVYYQYRDGPPAIYLTFVGPDLQRAGDDLKVSDKGARFPRIAGGDGVLGIAYADRGGPLQISVIDCR
jgi:hypothetical protein